MIEGFDISFNPDAFEKLPGQLRQADVESVSKLESDQNVIRMACSYLREELIPNLVCFTFAGTRFRWFFSALQSSKLVLGYLTVHH